MTIATIPPIEAPVVDAAPARAAERIEALDVIRGLAVLGILVMNIISFGKIAGAYMNPTATGPLDGADSLVWWFSHLLFDMKMMSLFSMLFGAGIVLFSSRLAERGARSGILHYRRMAVLLLIGLAHAYLLWHGDILVAYALCGMALYPLRRLSPRVLLILGVILLSIASGIFLAAGLSMQGMEAETDDPEAIAFVAEMEAMWTPTPQQVEEEVTAIRGSWLDSLPFRAAFAFEMQTEMFLFWGLWRVSGLMLLGMALFKVGFLTGRCSRGTYLVILLAFGLGGLALVLLGAWQNIVRGWTWQYSLFAGSQFNYWGSVAVALAWASAAALWVNSGKLRTGIGTLAAVGRMAMTNYLMQTILCTAFFYGWGLGYFERLSRAELLGVVAVVWALQLAWSPLWLRYFRFGPAEWAWRSATYGRLQPMRR